MNLSSNYLGLHLKHPFMPGASPLVDNLDVVKRLEDAGASAIVMHSLFEEQISSERLASIYHMEMYAESYAEALSYFPKASDFEMGPEHYLEHIRRIKETVAVPVIASLNGSTPGGWTRYAREMQQAGADALELNVYHLATDPMESGEEVEKRLLEVCRIVRQAVTIPVAVKLSPFFSALPNLACKLDDVGINGLVLFNRFYQPDIDLETLQIVPQLHFSTSAELLMRLRWTAILSGRIQADIAVSGGVHTHLDAIKAVMAGAHSVQVVAALLTHGPDFLRTLVSSVAQWMHEHEYDSLRQMQGSMNLLRTPDPAAFERANYMRILQSWRS
jgi:dihydroorotate dehydrogenase (fumarate)